MPHHHRGVADGPYAGIAGPRSRPGGHRPGARRDASADADARGHARSGPGQSDADTSSAERGLLQPGQGQRQRQRLPLRASAVPGVVERAIDNAIRNNPSLFDKSKNRCDQGCPFVRDTDGYWDAVTDEVRRLGYCATNDGEELAVKNSNSFNDQYDIINSEGFVRRGTGAYRSTCYPAWF